MAAARVSPKPMLTGAKITRVSLEMQVGNYSADAQDHKFAEIGREHGIVWPEEFRIDDEGYSGADFNRPSIKKAMRWVREGRINCVGWTEVDRFARNVEGGLATIRMFREAGAEVILGRLGPYRDESNFRMQMNLLLMMSEWQKDQIRNKSIEGVQAKIRRGLAHGGRSPFGWRFITAAELNARLLQAKMPLPPKPANSHEQVPEDQRTLRLMGELALAGESQRGICRELNARQIPPPSFKLFRKGVASGWNAETVARILRDKCYSTGVWHFGKKEYVAPKKFRKPDAARHRVRTVHKLRPESEWQPGQTLPGGPVWTPAEQQRIIEALERNGKMNVGKPAAEDGREAVLKGLVKCKCNYAVAPKSKTERNGKRSTWYLCTWKNRTTGEMLCPHRKSLKAQILEDAVWNGLREALLEKLDALVAEYRASLVADVDQGELQRMRALEPKLLRERSEAVRKELAAEDEDLKRDYSGRVAELTAEIKLLRRRLAAMDQESESIVVDTAQIQREVRTGLRATEPADRRQIVVAWIQGIVWAEDEAEITLRVPLKHVVANCQHDQHDAGNYIPLKLKVRVAA